MKYKDYLQSEKWKELRKKARKRAKGKCELCGGVPFNVHHVTYPKNLERDCLDNLLVICKKCHNKLHGIKNSKLQLMKIIEKRINWKDIFDSSLDYNGLDMSKTHDQNNTEITKHNIKILKIFEDYLDVNYISKHFDCWKGVCFWNLEEIIDKGGCNWGENEIEFCGWTSKDILFWLIINKGKYKEVKEDDSISKF